MAPSRFVAERLPDLPNARWVLLEDAGHHLLHTHAEEVIGEMGTFVESLIEIPGCGLPSKVPPG